MGCQVRVEGRNVDLLEERWQIFAAVKWDDVHNFEVVCG
jgi:hypothetical protein